MAPRLHARLRGSRLTLGAAAASNSVSGDAWGCAGLTIVYPDGVHALGPVDLSVQRGELVALLGPSGCGKSTLLLAMAGLVAPTAGQVMAGAKPPGLVFQDPTLMPWATILENVALPLTLAGVRRTKACAEAADALAVVGLSEAAKRRPAQLSGGMRMRAALARALVTGADALLLDEPFAAIDELGRRALDDLILDLKAERRLAVLFVTHSVEEACYLGDRVVVMSPRPGRVLADIAVARAQDGDGHLASEAFRAAAIAARAALRGGA